MQILHGGRPAKGHGGFNLAFDARGHHHYVQQWHSLSNHISVSYHSCAEDEPRLLVGCSSGRVLLYSCASLGLHVMILLPKDQPSCHLLRFHGVQGPGEQN